MCKQDGFVYFLGNLCEYLSSVVLCRFERKAYKWYIFKSHMQFHALAVMYFAAFFPILFIRYNFILLSNLLNSNFNSLENSERKKNKRLREDVFALLWQCTNVWVNIWSWPSNWNDRFDLQYQTFSTHSFCKVVCIIKCFLRSFVPISWVRVMLVDYAIQVGSCVCVCARPFYNNTLCSIHHTVCQCSTIMTTRKEDML